MSDTAPTTSSTDRRRSRRTPVDRAIRIAIVVLGIALAVTLAAAAGVTDVPSGAMFAFDAVMLLLCVGCLVLVRRRVLRPLGELRDAMEQFSSDAADFTMRLSEAGDDEVGSLRREFNDFVGNSQRVIERMMASSQTLSVASQQVASTSEQTGAVMNEISSALASVAAGADRQVQTVERTQATVVQMVEAARVTAANAEEARETSESARVITRSGMQTSEEAATSMELVRSTVQDTATAVRELGEKSKGIDAIVDTITGIAAQTNMLALNAAIEAARAGEQGRGFAVVADQVRKLAEESGQAAGHIAELVREIQVRTGQAVSAMETGMLNVEEARQTAHRSHDAFEAIRSAVDDIGARVQGIAASAMQLTEGSTEVESAIADVALIAQQSYAATQQVSVSTEQTVASAQQITGAVIQLARIADELGSEALKFGRAA
jgi:methyl-accepting chemotaxis protein